jgi:hypothetical protein
MKQSSYVVFAPAVQDRFWSRRAQPNERLAGGMENIRDTLPRPKRPLEKTARKKIPFDVLVDYCITYSVPWHILELGLDGALVRMDTHGLEAGATTDFVLRFKYHRVPVEHHIPAIVEKIEACGVSLRFGDYAEETRKDLVRLLHAL